MDQIMLCLALIGTFFVSVESVSMYRLTGVLDRQVRGFNNFDNGIQQPLFLTQPQPNTNDAQGIRDSIRRPTVNVNRNTGATSSSSISSNTLINQPKTLRDGAPSLKVGQGLAVAISIQGPQGAATNDSFANTQLFNQGEGDFGDSFANAGNTGPNSNTAQTGTNVHLQNDRPGMMGTANSFNRANVNMFGLGGNGGRTGSAVAVGSVGK